MHLEPIDYLLIGHVSQDATPDGPRLGGTVAYSAATAEALGLRVGVVTSAPDDFNLLDGLSAVQWVIVSAEHPTSFENIYDDEGKRRQILRSRATSLRVADVPQLWRKVAIAHLAPLADEVPSELTAAFPGALIGATPQGWMREWDDEGYVRHIPWKNSHTILPHATVTVFSIEDIDHDESLAKSYAEQAHILVVTRGENGCSVHWNGAWRHFPAPSVPVVDPTGAGDIFAAAYLYRLHLTGDPYEAAQFAVAIASASVARVALAGAPTAEDIQKAVQTAR